MGSQHVYVTISAVIWPVAAGARINTGKWIKGSLTTAVARHPQRGRKWRMRAKNKLGVPNFGASVIVSLRFLGNSCWQREFCHKYQHFDEKCRDRFLKIIAASTKTPLFKSAILSHWQHCGWQRLWVSHRRQYRQLLILSAILEKVPWCTSVHLEHWRKSQLHTEYKPNQTFPSG